MPDPTPLAENGTVLVIDGRRYRVSDLSFTDLEHRFSTGQAYTKYGSGRDRVMGFRTGVMTRLGDLEFSVWESLIRDLIHRSGEDALFQALIDWASEGCPWLHTRTEIERYALELHSSRIFDNPRWVDYLKFNQKYRPKILKEGENAHEHKQEIP